jgi:S1-C subfamily serine protease
LKTPSKHYHYKEKKMKKDFIAYIYVFFFILAVGLSIAALVVASKDDNTEKQVMLEKLSSDSSGTLVYGLVSQASCLIMTQFSDGISNGSGFCVELMGTDAVYVTATHVISNNGQLANRVTALINENTQVDCEIIAFDFASDTALIRTKGVDLQYMQPLQFAETSHIGDVVYALGNPLANDIKSISEGVIRDNHFVSSTFSGSVECMLTTCSILSGNSGGCFVNTQGQVVGISNFVYVSSYKQPSSTVVYLPQESMSAGANYFMLSRLIRGMMQGSLQKGFLGVTSSSITAGNELNRLRSMYANFRDSGLDLPRGLVVYDVVAPADGVLQIDDIIVSVDGLRVGIFKDEFSPTRVTYFKPNESVVVEFVRPSDATLKTINIVLSVFPQTYDQINTQAF